MDENKPDILKEKPLNALEIHNASTEDILTEQIETPSVEEAQPSETPVPTEASQTPPNEQTPNIETPSVDPEELKNRLKEELTAEISDDIAKKVIDAVAPERDKEIKPPWEEESRQPTYQEAIDWAAKQGLAKATPDLVETVKEAVKADLQKEVEDEQSAAKVAQDEEQTKIDQWQTHWDSEFATLESEGKIPKANMSDDSRDENGFYLDPGRRARQDVFGVMQRNIAQLQKEGKQPNVTAYSAELAFYKNYKPQDTQPAGANAPVFGASKSVTGSSTGNYTYSEVKNGDIESLLTELQNRG